ASPRARIRSRSVGSSRTHVAEKTGAAAIADVLELNEKTVGIGGVQFRRAARRSAAILHPHRHVRHQRTRAAGSAPSWLDAVALERLQDLVRIEAVHVETCVIDPC